MSQEIKIQEISLEEFKEKPFSSILFYEKNYTSFGKIMFNNFEYSFSNNEDSLIPKSFTSCKSGDWVALASTYEVFIFSWQYGNLLFRSQIGHDLIVDIEEISKGFLVFSEMQVDIILENYQAGFWLYKSISKGELIEDVDIKEDSVTIFFEDGSKHEEFLK